jgi:hypothetical protein
LLAAASVLLMAATAVLLVSVSSSGPDPLPEVRAPAGAAPSEQPGLATADRPDAERRWWAVLAGLDALRARAYAEMRPGLLRRVYTPGSRVLRRDRTLLLRYRRRGLRVVGLRVRVLWLRADARDGRVVLRVRDRVSAGTLVGAGGRRRLPRDGADVRAITLRRSGGHWRISEVTPA